ncbi:MAG TPA: membrane dipeptidase, partial [Rudaea sp.]
MSGVEVFRPGRRRALGALGAAAAVLASRPLRLQAAAAPAKKYSSKVVDIVQRSLVIDMLAPLKIDFNPDAFSLPLSDSDVEMFRTCGITGFHNSVGVGGATAYEEALQFIAAWSGFCGRNSEVFSLVGRAEDIDRAKAKKKIAVIMGLQNADEFRTPGDVKDFYDLGLRCAQLTYNSQNLIGSGSTERVDGGISDYGAAIIKAMNEVGMLIDVSHSGDRTTLDAIELSPKPIAIT